jgi:hypothetical protein
MYIYQTAAWGIIVSLSLMLVGGLVLWAYSARVPYGQLSASGLEAEATKRFHLQLARWFFIYGVAMVIGGLGLLCWSARYFI